MSIAQPVENWQSSIERGKEKSIRDDIVAGKGEGFGKGESYSRRERERGDWFEYR